MSRVGAGGTNYVGGSTAGDQRLGLNEWGYYSGIDTLRIVSQTTNKPTQQKTFDVNYIDIPMQRAGTTHTHTQTTNRTHNNNNTTNRNTEKDRNTESRNYINIIERDMPCHAIAPYVEWTGHAQSTHIQ